MDCLPFVSCSSPNRTLVNMTSFSHSYVRSYLEFRPSAYSLVNDLLYIHWTKKFITFSIMFSGILNLTVYFITLAYEAIIWVSFFFY